MSFKCANETQRSETVDGSRERWSRGVIRGEEGELWLGPEQQRRSMRCANASAKACPQRQEPVAWEAWAEEHRAVPAGLRSQHSKERQLDQWQHQQLGVREAGEEVRCAERTSA